MSDFIIRTEGLTKHYVLGAETVRAVRGVDIEITKGEFVAKTVFKVGGGID